MNTNPDSTHRNEGGKVEGAEISHEAFLRILDQTCERLIQRQKLNGWRPIDQAPKDGMDILLLIENSDIPVVGHYLHERWHGNAEHYDVSCGMWCQGGSIKAIVKPTHWRPLPEPPQS